MKRYCLDNASHLGFEEHPNGAWVRWEDAIAEIERLEGEVKKLRAAMAVSYQSNPETVCRTRMAAKEGRGTTIDKILDNLPVQCRNGMEPAEEEESDETRT